VKHSPTTSGETSPIRIRLIEQLLNYYDLRAKPCLGLIIGAIPA